MQRATMPRVRALAALTLGLALFPVTPLAGQDVEEAIRRLGAENARLYVHPVTAGLGAALASGLFYTASVHGPLGFDVGVRAMGAFVPRADESFAPVLPASLTHRGQTFEDPYVPRGELRSPTVVGEGEGMVAVPSGEFREALIRAGEDPSDFELRFPAGLDLPAVPFAVAQVSVGLPRGTEVSARFTPSVNLGDDVGSVWMLGFGLKHSLDQWLDLPPALHLAVAGGWQRMEAGDYLELDARHVALVVGGDVALLSPYAALGLESADAEVDYLLENQVANPALPPGGTRIRFEDEGENSVRGTAGLTLHLGVVKLNAEYAAADYPVATASLVVGTR